MLQVDNIKKRFGDRIIFDGLSLFVDKGDKIGLIAPNGSGKTTLLKIIMGIESYDDGRITKANDVRISYLEQQPQLPKGKTILEAVLQNNNLVSDVVRRYEAALMNGDVEESTRLLPLMDSLGGWDYDVKLKKILSSMGFDNLFRMTDNLSGGEVKRIALAYTLMDAPDLLLLDEPTNHLDLRTIEWLQEYLKSSSISLVMITHDRYFLDDVCNTIVEIDSATTYRYKGNYKYYLEKRAERQQAITAEIERAKNLFRKEREWMNRQPQARATKAKSRIDAFYELKEKISQPSMAKSIDLGNDGEFHLGKKIFEAKVVSLSFGDKKILNDFEYVFSRGEKLGIVGDNGVGKTSFLRLLLGEIAPDKGYFDIGQTIKFGYYSQKMPSFDPQKRVIDIVQDIAETFESNGATFTASQLLTRFLFTPSQQYTPVSKISGGEMRRLYLCTVLIKNPNFLILDEPTNDLDILTLNALEEYILDFSGCVIIVSHDRYFMDKIVDHIFVFEGNGIVKDFSGNYSDYRSFCNFKEKETTKIKLKESLPKSVRENQNTKKKLSYKEQRELTSVKDEISQLEKEKKEIEEVMSGGDISIDKLRSLSERIAWVTNRLDELALRWLELEE